MGKNVKIDCLITVLNGAVIRFEDKEVFYIAPSRYEKSKLVLVLVKYICKNLEINSGGKIINKTEVYCKQLSANGRKLDMSITKNGELNLCLGEYSRESLENVIKEINELSGLLIDGNIQVDDWF